MIPIIVANYNKPDLTEKCINSIVSTLRKQNIVYRIIQVNNGCKNNTVFAQGFVSFKEPLGFTKAYNEGIKYVRNSIHGWDKILFINNDVEVEGDWLKPLISIMDAAPKTAMVGNCFYVPGEDDPDNISTAEHADILGGNVFSCNRYLLPKAYKPVNSLQFHCILINRDFLDSCGILDENMVNFCSDMDLCFRAGQNGWRQFLCFDSIVKHYQNSTVKEFGENGPEMIKSDQNYFLAKWSGTHFKNILKQMPLYETKKDIYCDIKFYMVQKDGSILDWHKDTVVGQKTGIVTENVRQKVQNLKSMGLNR